MKRIDFFILLVKSLDYINFAKILYILVHIIVPGAWASLLLFMDDQIERIKQKQALFKEQKRLFEEKITTQEEFERYIASLHQTELCAFMTGIKEIVSVCNMPHFSCRFRSEELYSVGELKKKECRREKMLHYEMILGRKH